MDIEIIKERDNLLLNRKEMTLNISHNSGATPSRDDVKKRLVAELNSQYDLVVVDRLTTEFGAQKTTVYAKVYSDVNRVNQVENKHIIERNKAKPVEEPKAEEEVDAKVEKTSGEEPKEAA